MKKGMNVFLIFNPYFSVFYSFDWKCFYSDHETFKNYLYIIFGARMSILMNIFDGLGPSIFRQKIERIRAMREELDREGFYFPPELALSVRCLSIEVLFLI